MTLIFFGFVNYRPKPAAYICG